jgi:hypothetical protein
MTSRFRQCALALVLALSLIARADQSKPAATSQPPAIHPKADKILKDMSAAMAAAKSLSFSAHAIADQFTPEGQKLQFAKNQKVVLSRPGKLAADVTGDLEDLTFRYDGKRVTLYNPRTKSWGATDAPATIEDTLDMLAEKYQMPMPLADLAFSDPYKCLTENVRSGEYLGVGYVFDAKCHHLAFRQAAVDWQIWIEDGAKPMPRKVVITFKESPGHPQYTAFLSDWNLNAAAPDSAFAFTPPAGSKQVEFTSPASAKEQPAREEGKK